MVTQQLKIWVDDRRPPPHGENWGWAHDPESMKTMITYNKRYGIISLDFDMGSIHPNGRAMLQWLIEHKKCPPIIKIHTVEGIPNMVDLLLENGYEYKKGLDGWIKVRRTD